MGQGQSEGLRETLRVSGSFARGRRRSLVAIAVASTIGGFAEAAVLVVVARLAFALASDDSEVRVSLGPLGRATLSFGALVAIAVGVTLFRMALQTYQTQLSATTSAQVNTDIRVRLTRSFLAASWNLQSAQRTGRLQEMVGSYAAYASSITLQFANGIVALASLVTFLVTAFFVSAIAAIGVAAGALLLGVLLRPLRRAARRSSGQTSRKNLIIVTDVTEMADHALEVRAFGVEKTVGDRLVGELHDVATLDAKSRFLSGMTPVVYQGSALLFLIITIAVLDMTQVSRLGAVGGVVLIMIRSLSYGQQLQSCYQSVHSAVPQLLVLREELELYSAAELQRSGEPVDRIGELTFESVDFEYVPDVPVLRDVSFVLRPGEIVGVVGPSGAGKSTLVQLALRLREPTRGRVLADGRDVRKLSLDDWYQRVSFVPQDPALVAGSIADNIRFYRDDVDQAAIERASKLANLHDEVVAWPDGYDTSVGERGGQLSGGQRQRLCIARALVDEPDVLVFDEPTSSLDVRSEALIRDAMAGLAPRTTVIVIAHRLSTLSVCDRIMVVLDGTVQGFDSPERLEANNPFYREALELSGLR
jgi:ABC-type multidrug transport system fused ATPase/permease subunit